LTARRTDDLDRYLDPWIQLLVCLIIDAVGMGFYYLPVMGEAIDIPDGFLESIWVYYMLNGQPGSAGAWATFDFIKEVLGPLCIIPGCTMAWIWKYQFRK